MGTRDEVAGRQRITLLEAETRAIALDVTKAAERTRLISTHVVRIAIKLDVNQVHARILAVSSRARRLEEAASSAGARVPERAVRSDDSGVTAEADADSDVDLNLGRKFGSPPVEVTLDVHTVSPLTFSATIALTDGGIWVRGISVEDCRRVRDAIVAGGCGQAVNGPVTALLDVLAIAETTNCHVSVKGYLTPGEAVCYVLDECLDKAGDELNPVDVYQHSEIRDVYCVRHPDQALLAAMFVRVQQFYEDASDSIRGHAFTVDGYKAGLRRSGEPFDYYLKWPGFNVPGWAVHKLRSGAMGSIRPCEAAMLEALALAGATEASYVIGVVCGDVDTLDHELAHGLYATNLDYKAGAEDRLQQLAAADIAAMRASLLKSTYPNVDEILRDEMQAYLVGGDELGGVSDVIGLRQYFLDFIGRP